MAGRLGSSASLQANFSISSRARESKLHLAVYDFRLSDVVGGDIVAALRDRAAAGVDVKIAYDASKPDTAVGFLSAAADPAPVGTEQFLRTAFEGSNVKMKAIRGQKLMHNKYVIKDGNTSGAAVWTGSTNFTDDAWTLQENNIVIVELPELCIFYENDFNDLWSSGDIAGSGAGDYASVNVDGVRVEVNFSPANGPKIDQRIASIISGATRRIRLASMLISSRGVIAALDDTIAHAQVESIDGLYDKTQMQQTLDSGPRSAEQTSSPPSITWLEISPARFRLLIRPTPSIISCTIKSWSATIKFLPAVSTSLVALLSTPRMFCLSMTRRSQTVISPTSTGLLPPIAIRVDRASSACMDSSPRILSGSLPGSAERGAFRFCRGVRRA